jgi:hypothetical protein
MGDFERIDFGIGHAHRMHDSDMMAAVKAAVPRVILNRSPRTCDDDNAAYVSTGDYMCSLLPPGTRVLMVLLRFEGRKMCVLLTPSDMLLVTLSVEGTWCDRGTVFEGFLVKEQQTGRMQFQITDTLVVRGVLLDMVPYDLRKLVAHVFAVIKVRPGKDGTVLLVLVAADVNKEDLGRLLAAKQRILLQPRTESFLDQNRLGSYLIIE